MLARESGKPVRVAWTRHEEFTSGTLRPAAVIDIAAGANADGELVAWTFTNVNSGQAAIAPPTGSPTSGSTTEPACSPLSQGSYRALAATANNFARESQIDELAHQLGRTRSSSASDNLGRRTARHGAASGGRALRMERPARWRRVGASRAASRRAAEWPPRPRSASTRRPPAGRPSRHRLRVRRGRQSRDGDQPDRGCHGHGPGRSAVRGGPLHRGSRSPTAHSPTIGCRRIGDVPPIEVVLLDRPDLPSAGAGETPDDRRCPGRRKCHLRCDQPAPAVASLDGWGHAYRVVTIPLPPPLAWLRRSRSRPGSRVHLDSKARWRRSPSDCSRVALRRFLLGATPCLGWTTTLGRRPVPAGRLF